MRLIRKDVRGMRTFEEVQDELRECINHAYRDECEDIEKFGSNIAHLDNAMQLLNELIEIYNDSKDNWIPVKTALPEEGKSVLVCLKTQGGMAQAVSERFNISGEWRWSALGGRKPLAWQPLPENYKIKEGR